MTLIDTGPIIALLNKADPDHLRCLQALRELTGPLLTTWPVITEAMHFLGKSIGPHGQQALWRMLRDGKLRLVEPLGEASERMATLTAKYHDIPMDLADASIVASAEKLGLDRVFTLDGDFLVYRLDGRKGFTIVPKPGR